MVRAWATRTVFIALSVIALCIVCAFALARLQGGQTLSVQSGSMRPSIKKGDLVIVKSVPDYQVGDVITFINPRNRSTTVTHRIVAIHEDGSLRTKGDANQADDLPVSPSMVIGKVQRTVPYLGYGMDFVRRPLGLLIVIYIPALMVLAHEIRLLAQHYKRMQPYLAPGRRHQRRNPTGGERLAAGIKSTVFLTALLLAAAIPARAALSNQALVAGNNVEAAEERLTDNIVLRRVEFKCSLDNTETVNKLPDIIMHNPTDQDISTGGWYIESSEGRLVTFRPQTVFDTHDDFDIEPDLTDGVHYQGDFLALFDSTGTLVDAISWGTDTTYLNPPLPGIQDGTVFRRVDLMLETNTFADWAVSVAPCADED